MIPVLEAVQIFFQSYLPMIRLRLADVLDIAILSYLIYKGLWMLRKTSSGRVLRGIIILMLAMWLSSEIPLTATSFLLDRVVELGFVALVVLFQPELRRVLERMGSSRLGLVFASNKTNTVDLGQAISETTEAYTSMSRDKVGALMVFERQDLLDDVIKKLTD